MLRKKYEKFCTPLKLVRYVEDHIRFQAIESRKKFPSIFIHVGTQKRKNNKNFFCEEINFPFDAIHIGWWKFYRFIYATNVKRSLNFITEILKCLGGVNRAGR